MLGRRRPLLRAAAVGGAGYALGKRKAGPGDEEPRADVTGGGDRPDGAPSGPSASALDELEKLGKLKEQGILTQDEFDTQKAKILGAS
jgi:hypothetical protein